MSQIENDLRAKHDFSHEVPVQQKFREMAVMPIGCVFIAWPEMTRDDIRGHFRQMKELGFTCLKDIMPCPGTSISELRHLALDEGLIPWWYDEAGWERITPKLLRLLGLPEDMPIADAMDHPAVREHQEQVMRRRIDREAAGDDGKLSGGVFLPGERDPEAVPGVNKLSPGCEISVDEVPHFVGWLQRAYPDVEALKHAWNCFSSSHGLAAASWESWQDVQDGLMEYPSREFRHLRDILRFKADAKLARLRGAMEACQAADANAPVRAGGEISIFLPHTASAIDMEGYAQIIAEGGCFYPSMHPGWHLEEVEFELVRPTYMQASMCADWAKGNWSAPIESSGGPQWWSGGGKVPFVPAVRSLQPAFTFTANTMAQLICTYLGAGFKGFGLWCWNPREAGWEAGEYALCDRNNDVTDRARLVGQFGRAMRKYRRELWDARKQPIVGLYQDWENDAMWAALAHSGRDRYKNEPTKARIGAARALINANVPWEHVTGRQLSKDIAARYRVIYLPAAICLTKKLLAMLCDFVRQGGRLVLDMPGAWLDERGHLIDTCRGSAFEQLFGVVLHEYAYANNVPFRLAGSDIEGFTAVMTPTNARVTQAFDNGSPAITEHTLGDGTAVILGVQASLSCLRPGCTDMERVLVETALGSHQTEVTCDHAILYRLAGRGIDHLFLINDGAKTEAILRTASCSYDGATDAVTGQPIDLTQPIPLDADSGRWIRAVRSGELTERMVH